MCILSLLDHNVVCFSAFFYHFKLVLTELVLKNINNYCRFFWPSSQTFLKTIVMCMYLLSYYVFIVISFAAKCVYIQTASQYACLEIVLVYILNSVTDGICSASCL